MTYVRPPGADLAEGLVCSKFRVEDLEEICVDHCYMLDQPDSCLSVRDFIVEAVRNYSRVREENDALRHVVTADAQLLSHAAEDLAALDPGPAQGRVGQLVTRIREQLAAVAALSRKVESDV